MLVDVPPRIGPIIVDLTAEHVPADAPHVLILAVLLEIIVTHADVVDVGDLERQVIEPGLLVREAEEHVVIDIAIAAVAAIERADDVVLVLGIDVVGADKSQRLAEPVDGLAEARRHQHAMTGAFDMRGATRQPHQFTGAR